MRCQTEEQMLSPEMLATNKNVKMIYTQHSMGLYTFPLLSRCYCNNLVDRLVDFTDWTSDRHANYPTNDVLLKNFCQETCAKYDEMLRNVVLPCVRTLFDAPLTSDMKHETFVVRYRPDVQATLDFHHDQSTFSVITTLSDISEYEGGGTVFPAHGNLFLKTDIGVATVHPGNLTHKHGTRPVTAGVRFAIVSFCRL